MPLCEKESWCQIMKTLRYQIWEGRKCMESISDFSIVDHPISLMFHLQIQENFGQKYGTTPKRIDEDAQTKT